MTCYNFRALSLVENFKKNPLQDLLSSLNAVTSTIASTRIITGHVIYNLAYTYKFQLKITYQGCVESRFEWTENFLKTYELTSFWTEPTLLHLTD